MNSHGKREYRSIPSNQIGFNVDETTGRDGWTEVGFSKLGTMPIRCYRPISENADIKKPALWKENPGEWFVSVAIETVDEALPETSGLDSLDAVNSVGRGVGFTPAHGGAGNPPRL